MGFSSHKKLFFKRGIFLFLFHLIPSTFQHSLLSFMHQYRLNYTVKHGIDCGLNGSICPFTILISSPEFTIFQQSLSFVFQSSNEKLTDQESDACLALLSMQKCILNIEQSLRFQIHLRPLYLSSWLQLIVWNLQIVKIDGLILV